jgi:hypothetical protein
VFVPNAHEHIVPVPEDCPAILFLDTGGANLAFVVKLVTADVDAVRVQVGPSPSVRNGSPRWRVDRQAGLIARRPLASTPRKPHRSARSAGVSPTIRGVWVRCRVLATAKWSVKSTLVSGRTTRKLSAGTVLPTLVRPALEARSCRAGVLRGLPTPGGGLAGGRAHRGRTSKRAVPPPSSREARPHYV